MRGTIIDRFEAKAYPEPNSGCWLWTGAVNERGYGQIRINGKTVAAHRTSYQIYVGNIPNGLQIDHLCKNPSCVNPQHLEPVSAQENVRRSTSGQVTAALQRKKTHCPKGHPYYGDNLYIHPENKSRSCKTCIRDGHAKLRQDRAHTRNMMLERIQILEAHLQEAREIIQQQLGFPFGSAERARAFLDKAGK